MKIAFVSQGFGKIIPPKAEGSISIWTFEIIKVLSPYHNIIVYEMDGSPYQKKTLEYLKTFFIYAPVSINNKFNRILDILFKLKNKFLETDKVELFSPFYNLAYILFVAINLRKQKADIIHVIQFTHYVTILRFFNPQSRIALHMHSEWLSQLDYTLMKRRLKHVDLIIGCSDYICAKIKARFPEFGKKIHVVYNGVNVRSFDAKDVCKKKEIFNLLFVGRISPEKGIHLLLDAFKQVVKEFPETMLYIVGSIGSAPKNFIVSISDEPLVQNLERFYMGEAKDYYYKSLQTQLTNEVANKVVFAGRCSHDEVIDFYKKAHVVINPSLSESFGMSLVEGMVCEIPVIASRIGGMVNVVNDGKTGVLVEPGNVSELANAIILLLKNEELRTRLGTAGRKKVTEKFVWERVGQSLIESYESVI